MHTKLSDYLASTGETQTSVARKIGVSRQAIAQYLTGEARPTLDMALKMRDVLGISVDSWRRPARAKAVRR